MGPAISWQPSGIKKALAWVGQCVNPYLEQRVEIPEGALDEVVGWHLRETHFQEDLPELSSDFEKRMKVTAWRHDA